MLTSLRQAIYNSLFFFKALHFLDCIHTLLASAFSTADSAHVSMTTAGTSGRPTIGLAIAPDDVKKAFGCRGDVCQNRVHDVVRYFPSPVGWIHLERCCFRCRDPFLHVKICPKRMVLRCCRC